MYTGQESIPLYGKMTPFGPFIEGFYMVDALKKVRYKELIIAVILLVATNIALTVAWFPVLDWVNLIFHEAGHSVFFWAGEFLNVLGGTLGQLLVPLVMGIYFIRKGKWIAALAMLWWVGQNFVGIGLYAGDARVQALDLIGGDHDWTYLLGRLGLINKDLMIANIFDGIAKVLMGTSIGILLVRGLYPAYRALKSSQN